MILGRELVGVLFSRKKVCVWSGEGRVVVRVSLRRFFKGGGGLCWKVFWVCFIFYFEIILK